MSFEVVINNNDLPKNGGGVTVEETGAVHSITPESSPPMSKAVVVPENGDDKDELVQQPRMVAPIPPMALEVLGKIHEEPLPRSRTLSRVLSRLLPLDAMTDSSILTAVTCQPKTLRNHLGRDGNTSVVVAISSIPEEWSDPSSLGMGGVGKSTMAAMVTTHVDVRRYYHEGIAWVNVGSQEMNYAHYVACLKELLSQLIPETKMPVFPVLLRTPCEATSIRQGRQEGFMCYARDVVSQILQDRNVLIVLNNVEYSTDLDWFCFSRSAGSCSSVNGLLGESNKNARTLLVVTSRRDLVLPTETIEVDLLYEQEAMRLMVTESGQIMDRALAETREARLLAQVCANHPLAIKCVARWLSLKHAKQAAGAGIDGAASEDVLQNVHKSLKEVAHSLDKQISKKCALREGLGSANSANDEDDEEEEGEEDVCDAMYEILGMAFSPAVNGKPTLVIKFCFAALVMVFCKQEYHSLFTPLEAQPKIPMGLVETLLSAVLKLEEDNLTKEGSSFFSQLSDAIILIPEALSALGVVKVIHEEHATDGFDDASSMSLDDDDDDSSHEEGPVYLQLMHRFFQEYGDYLATEHQELQELCVDAERRWNKEFVSSYLETSLGWDIANDNSRAYMAEMIVSHMIRAEMYQAACRIIQDRDFVQARVETLGRENATRQHITDCEALCEVLARDEGESDTKKRSRVFMIGAYKLLGDVLSIEDSDTDVEEEDPNYFVETGRAHYEIGLSLAEKRYWSAAIRHWETSQEILVSSLGVEEFVAAVLFNIGVAYSEICKHKKALSFLKRCLRIRGAIHGERHILFAITVQKIGDVFLAISDFEEAMECYTFALDVMYVGLNYYRIDIGDILENMGNIHYSKGQIQEALQCYQDALHSKEVELGDDHPELAGTHQKIGNCLSDQNMPDDAIIHFEKAIWLRRLNPDADEEQQADVLSIEGVLYNLQGRHDDALASYEKCLDLLETHVPHKKEKIAALLHLVGCVCLVTGDYDKAMEYFEKSLAARDNTLGFVQLEVASTLFNIAFLHQSCNRLDKALEFLEASLKIRLELLPDSEKVALTHEKIAILSDTIGDTERATNSFKETLRIRKVIHGDDHELVAAVLHELGDMMDEIGDYDEAIKYFEEALKIRNRRLGADHEDVASTLYSMAFTLHHQDKSERALHCFEEALNIRKVRLGEDAKEVADALNMMGCLKAKRGESDGALSLLWEALKIRKLHNDVLKVAEILKNIGNVHREKQEYELAAECYEECLRIRRDEFGDEHEKVADALVALGSARSDHQDHDEGRKAYEEALSIRTLLYGNGDMRVAEVCQYMGATEFQCGNYDRAQRYLQEFVRIRGENQEEKTEELVNVMLMIGNIHKIEGRDSVAADSWSEAYEVFQELNMAEANPLLGVELKKLNTTVTSSSDEADDESFHSTNSNP